MSDDSSVDVVDCLVTLMVITLLFAWIVSWFLAIWIDQYRIKLLFTGLFSLFLFLMIGSTLKDDC